MSEKDLEQLKKEAAKKAKEAALRKMQEKQAKATPNTEEDLADAKKKAAEAAKKRALELSKQQDAKNTTAKEESPQQATKGDADIAKAKAAAAAKAKAAALAKAKAANAGEQSSNDSDEKAKAKAKAAAAAKAKAAALAKAKTKGAKSNTEAQETKEEPSPNQPYLDKYMKVIQDHLGDDVLEDAYINKLSNDMPTLVAKPDTYYKIAEFLKYNEQLGFDYVSEHHGTDFVTHMEVYNSLYSYKNRQAVALKVKIDRENPVIESLTPLWPGANWPEREAYDLLGIQYKNHPNLKRIMLADDWVGHPLRKDYEQYDVEV